jgi:hypothetical protein
MRVEAIGGLPCLEQPGEVGDAEAAIGQRRDVRLIAQVLNNLVHQRKARCRHLWCHSGEVADHVPLRPALTRILWREQRTNDACRRRRPEFRAGARLHLDRLAAGPLDQQDAGDLEPAVAGEVVPAPAVLLT